MAGEINIAQCFQFKNPSNGDTVISLLPDDYIKLIGIQTCVLLSTAKTQGAINSNLDGRLRSLENKPAPSFILPSFIPSCVLPANLTPMDQILVALEQQFCQLRGASGTTTEIYESISTNDSALGNSPAVGTGGGLIKDLTNWQSPVVNAADSIQNIWAVIHDLYSAIINIKANCCATPCNGVAIKMTASLPNASILKLFFTGTIPSSLIQCSGAGTMFNIADQSGNSINVTLDLIANLNNPSGYPITLTSTPINTADDLTITSTVCFKDGTINGPGTICQSVLSLVFVNTLSCPVVTFISGLTTINFSFVHNSGALTYIVQLYDNTGNTQIAAQTFLVSNPVIVTGTFSGLTEGTNYKVRVLEVATTKTTYCPFVVVATSPNPCPPPRTVQAVITLI